MAYPKPHDNIVLTQMSIKARIEKSDRAINQESHTEYPTTITTNTDAPHTDHNDHMQTTSFTPNDATDHRGKTQEQGDQTDSDYEQEKWEGNSQGDKTYEEPQTAPESEVTTDLLGPNNHRELIIEEGEQCAPIERGTHSILARKRLSKHTKTMAQCSLPNNWNNQAHLQINSNH